MPLEATMMIIDNSEYMRNGDYIPTRFSAQSDAVNTVFQTKTDSNPENTVGIMTMAGKAPEVLVTHSKDLGQILNAIHTTSSRIGGSIDIPTAIAVAQLALKHRENKNLRQRIVVFVGSPMEVDEKAMVKLGKKLKKNNVAVDVVAFGDGIEEGESVLKAFVDSVSSSDNSHMVTVPPTGGLLSDALISSPILSADREAGIPDDLIPGGSGASAGGGGGGDFEFGVDPSLDPELAMVLRMSMQEAQAREDAERAATTTSSTSEPTKPAAETTAEDDEEAELQKALALSQDVNMDSAGKEDDDDDDDAMDEDERIAQAIAMSMQKEEEEQQKKEKK